MPFILLNQNQIIRHISDSILDKTSFDPIIELTEKNFETAKRLAYYGIRLTFAPLQLGIFTNN